MKYCSSCHIKYESPLDKCLFCNNLLITSDSIQTNTEQRPAVFVPLPPSVAQREGNYPVYQKIHHRRRIFLRLMAFLVIVTNFLCIFIDGFMNHGVLNWSVVVTASTFYALLVLATFTKRSLFLSKIIHTVLLTDVLLLVIGIAAKNYTWCTSFVLPITIMTLNLFSVCHLFGKKLKMYDYSIYSISLSILGLLLGLLLVTNFLSTPWAIVTCMFYSGVTLLALFLFSPKAAWEEFLRRFHF